jgi:hypothetical protein
MILRHNLKLLRQLNITKNQLRSVNINKLNKTFVLSR